MFSSSDLVSVADLAALIDKSPQSVRRAIRLGQIPAVKIGSSYVVNLDSLRERILEAAAERRKRAK